MPHTGCDDATRRDAHRASWPGRKVTDPPLATTTAHPDDPAGLGFHASHDPETIAQIERATTTTKEAAA